jgi:hypothetical protein
VDLGDAEEVYGILDAEPAHAVPQLRHSVLNGSVPIARVHVDFGDEAVHICLDAEALIEAGA